MKFGQLISFNTPWLAIIQVTIFDEEYPRADFMTSQFEIRYNTIRPFNKIMFIMRHVFILLWPSIDFRGERESEWYFIWNHTNTGVKVHKEWININQTCPQQVRKPHLEFRYWYMSTRINFWLSLDCKIGMALQNHHHHERNCLTVAVGCLITSCHISTQIVNSNCFFTPAFNRRPHLRLNCSPFPVH